MSAPDANMALADLINSLDLSKVPDKLHCPGCNKFLSNAFKTPCCDQAICETCQSSIQDQCPVCDHSPLTPDLCNPSKAVRTTAKAYLKTAEKKLADERAKTEASAIPVATPAIPQEAKSPPQRGDDENPDSKSGSVGDVVRDIADQPQPSIETPSQTGVSSIVQEDVGDKGTHQSTSMDFPKDSNNHKSIWNGMRQQTDPACLGESDKPDTEEEATTGSEYKSKNVPSTVNMNSGLNNGMDYSQMMQLMSGNLGSGMASFGPMMGMPNLGMGPVPGMFGNMGGPGVGMAGMNGMNMGMNMNFNHGQGTYGGWHSGPNMWSGPQNNNPNAFVNGMGGNFGPNAGFGYNMSQPSSFHQQQFTNGDFQSGHYGRGPFRGRGRGRPGFRGRGGGSGGGGLNPYFPGNFSHNSQHPYEQQQHQIRQLQAKLGESSNDQPATRSNESKEAQLKSFHDELAPGGQEEVDEALGVTSIKPDLEKPVPDPDHREDSSTEDKAKEVREAQGEAEVRPSKPGEDGVGLELPQQEFRVSAMEEEPSTGSEVPEVYKENVGVAPSMPPPAAPLGPATRLSDPSRDTGFRGRGPGRFASRGRANLYLPNGAQPPSKISPDLPLGTPTEPKGAGIVGAPTGPKAMRSPAVVPPSPRGRGGFQIVGRAAMLNQQHGSLSHNSEARTTEQKGEDGSRSPSSRCHNGRTDHSRSCSNHDAESEGERRRRRERRHRRSKPDEYSDEEMLDSHGHHELRSSVPDLKRKLSHRNRDRDRHGSGSKHGSSRHHHHYHDEDLESSPYDDEPSSARRSRRSSKDLPIEAESRSGGQRDRQRRHRHHHSSRSSRRDGRDPDPDREDRHRRRKRSRREGVDNGEGGGGRGGGGETDNAEASESRHRSRRHKRTHDYEPDERRNGTSHSRGSSRFRHESSHRQPTASTNISTGTTTTTTATSHIPPKDMHTREREARDRERLVKEQQRRENAEKERKRAKSGGTTIGPGGGGRRTSYKYEDEMHDRMVESERARDRWR